MQREDAELGDLEVLWPVACHLGQVSGGLAVQSDVNLGLGLADADILAHLPVLLSGFQGEGAPGSFGEDLILPRDRAPEGERGTQLI